MVYGIRSGLDEAEKQVLSERGWVPQQSQPSTESLEDPWRIAGVQSTWKPEDAGF